MDNKQLLNLISESANFEKNVAKLYLLLSKSFNEDSRFWLNLYIEEKNHQTIFELFLEGDIPLNLFPEEVIDKDVKNLKHFNELLKKELDGFLKKYRKKADAYEFALKMEEASSEGIFQDAMDIDSNSEELYLIQRINKDDKDHKRKIRNIISKLKNKYS